MAGIVVEWKIGALAQLGEHLLCKQRVIGSIPIGSTIIIQDKKHKFAASLHVSQAACSPTIVKKKTDLEGSSPKSPQGFCLLLRGAAFAASTVLSVKGSGRRFIAFVQVITPFAIDRCCLTAHRRGSSREAGLSPVGFSHPTGKMAPLQDVGSGCTPGRC